MGLFGGDSSSSTTNTQWSNEGEKNIDAPAALVTGISGDDYRLETTVNTTETDHGAIGASFDFGRDALVAAYEAAGGANDVVAQALLTGQGYADANTQVSRDAIAAGNSYADKNAQIVDRAIQGSNDLAASLSQINTETGKHAMDTVLASARDGFKVIGDTASEAMYTTGGTADTAMRTTNDLGTTALLAQLETLGSSYDLVDASDQREQEATFRALDFAQNATRSEASINTSELIKWGFGAAAVVAIGFVLKGQAA